ncbi:uncharacterized protein [Montipora foliosa]|uniref:uncharacterized protein n=2 Tax=Montipora TaxID=46703 RepID=UPI0035F164AB
MQRRAVKMFPTLVVQISLVYTVGFFVFPSYGRMQLDQDGDMKRHGLTAFKSRDKFFRLTRTHLNALHTDLKEGEQLPEIPCELYPEVVQVEPSIISLRNDPQFVQVNRCKGSCGLPLILQKCKPTTIRVRKVKVRSHDGREYVKNIEDHIDCTCACQATCNETHVFDGEKCICRCSEKCQDGEQQNPETCKCSKSRKE